MEPSFRFKAWSPCSVPLSHHHPHHHHRHHHHHHRHHHHHHHHHHRHPHQFCSRHSRHHHHHCNGRHPQLCTGLPPFTPQNTEPPVGSTPLPKDLNLLANFHQWPSASPGDQVLAEQGYDGFEEAGEEEEDPVFVLTDEWRDFFVRSEAKRRLEKQQAKRKEKC